MQASAEDWRRFVKGPSWRLFARNLDFHTSEEAVTREPTPFQVSSLATVRGLFAGITLFSFGVQSKSSIPRRSRPRRKGNGESHANTYVATSVRSMHATDDESEETQPAEAELVLAMLHQASLGRPIAQVRRSMRPGRCVLSC